MTSSSEIKLNETVSMHKFKIWKSNGVRSDEYGEGSTVVNQQTIKSSLSYHAMFKRNILDTENGINKKYNL